MNRFVRKMSVPERDGSFEPGRKAALRKHLLNYISVRQALKGAHMLRESVASSEYVHETVHIMPIAVTIIVAFLLGGGISAAAEHALPGDVLYPVKIFVNENVRAALEEIRTVLGMK